MVVGRNSRWTAKQSKRSSRREWLAPVLSHHRAYRSVHGGFNSWRAQTDRLWLNHKSHCLSVFLLSLPCLLQLYALRTNIHVGYYPLALPSLRALPSWWGYVPLSSVSSTVSIYTYVFCDRAIRWFIYVVLHTCNSVVVKPSPRIHLDFLKAWLDWLTSLTGR